MLKENFSEVMIPRAVFNELTSDRRFIDEAEQVTNCEYIKVEDVLHAECVEELRRTTGLDLGESEAIVLSDEIQAELLLIDEAAGRRIARKLGKNIMGVIGLLIVSFEKGFISSSEIRESAEVLKISNRKISPQLFELLIEKTQAKS